MAMTKESMANSIQAAIASIGQIQSEGGSPDPVAQSRLFIEAWCQGIINELQTNGVITTTSGAPDGEHTGNIS